MVADAQQKEKEREKEREEKEKEEEEAKRRKEEEEEHLKEKEVAIDFQRERMRERERKRRQRRRQEQEQERQERQEREKRQERQRYTNVNKNNISRYQWDDDDNDDDNNIKYEELRRRPLHPPNDRRRDPQPLPPPPRGDTQSMSQTISQIRTAQMEDKLADEGISQQDIQNEVSKFLTRKAPREALVTGIVENMLTQASWARDQVENMHLLPELGQILGNKRMKKTARLCAKVIDSDFNNRATLRIIGDLYPKYRGTFMGKPSGQLGMKFLRAGARVLAYYKACDPDDSDSSDDESSPWISSSERRMTTEERQERDKMWSAHKRGQQQPQYQQGQQGGRQPMRAPPPRRASPPQPHQRKTSKTNSTSMNPQDYRVPPPPTIPQIRPMSTIHRGGTDDILGLGVSGGDPTKFSKPQGGGTMTDGLLRIINVKKERTQRHIANRKLEKEDNERLMRVLRKDVATRNKRRRKEKEELVKLKKEKQTVNDLAFGFS